MTVEFAVVLSNWMWRHMVVDAPGHHGIGERESRSDWNREATLRRLCAILLPPSIESPGRRRRYADWVDESVLQPLRPANSNLVEEALTAICNMIPDRDSDAEIFGTVFLAQLPESCRQYLLTQLPDRARQWGFETRRTFGLEGDVAIVRSGTVQRGEERAFGNGIAIGAVDRRRRDDR